MIAQRPSLRLLVLGWFLLALTACSEPPPAQQQAAAQSSNLPFQVLDISERSLDNAPALSVMLSQPLKPGKRHDAFFRVEGPQGLVKGAWVLADNQRLLYFPHIQPQTKYRVTVDAGLVSAAGATLGSSVSREITTRKIAPVVSFLSQGLLLPKDLAEGLPVVTVNVPEVDVEFFRFKPESLRHVSRWIGGSGESSYYELQGLRQMAELAYSGRFALDAPPNKRSVSHLPVRDIDGLKAPGLYVAVMRQPGEYSYRHRVAHFFVSDVGVQARLYEHGALVVASSLKTGKPLADVRVAVQNDKGEEVLSGRTDRAGQLKLDKPLRGLRLLLAEHGRDVSFLPLTGPALDLSAFDLGSRVYQPLEVFTYSPRDLYRAGERVTVAALLRDQDGKPVPPRPLHARLLRPDHQEAWRFQWHPENLKDVNYFQTTLALPENAPSGPWQLELRVDPGQPAPSHVFRFLVEDFLPERMSLELTAPEGVLAPAEPAELEVTGKYLYGAVAAGNELQTQLTVRAHRELLPAWPDFEFGDARQTVQDGVTLDPVQLDEAGKAKLSVPSRWESATTPLQLSFTATLLESGGRPVTRTLARQVWPAEALVGIRPEHSGDYVDPGSVGFQLIKADPSGTLVALKDLQIRLIREDRDYYWEYNSERGWHWAYSEREFPLFQQALDLSAKAPARVAFPLEYGHYRLEATDPDTGLTSSHRFRVGWWSHEQGSGSARPDQVNLRLDKPAYRAGDTARLTVVPPHAGEALILVEGNSLLWAKRVSVKAEGTEIAIPVDASWDRHDLYVTAVVFRPGEAKEKITPNRAVGLLPLRLERGERRLELSLTAPEKVQPLKPLEVDLQLKGAGTGPVYVTVSAVDVGILSLTQFATPDPFAWFFEPRRYGVETYDVYGKVIELVEGDKARIRFGGDAELANAGQQARSRLEFVTLYSGPLAVDAQGRAKLRFDLPDFNGRLRLMATAFGADRFGSAERDVTVAAPVVAELSMPRFLAGGDRSTFTLDLHNLSGADEELSVELAVSEPLTLTDGKRKLKLADGGRQTLRFAVEAEPAFATAAVSLRVKGEQVDFTRQWKLDVRPPYPGLTRRAGAVVRPGETYRLDPALTEGLVASTVQGYLSVSARPPLELAEHLADLLAYPYGCLEQTTSSAYPWLFITPELASRYGLPAYNQVQIAERVNFALRRIADKQLPSGGFGLWDRDSFEEPWLTPYATGFLLDAREQGFPVSDGVLDAALTRLQQYLQRSAHTSLLDNFGQEPERLRFAATAYSAYLLARVNRAPLGTLRILFEQERRHAQDPLPLVHLGLALHLQGDRDKAVVALKESLTKLGKPREWYYGDYGSEVRDLASMIYLLNKHEVTLEGGDELVFKLADALRARRWLSTQERNALFLAGVALDEARQPGFAGTLVLGGQEESVEDRQRLVARPSLTALRQGVSFTSRAERPLYLNAAVAGYPQKAPPVLADQVRIERAFYQLDGKPLPERALKVGELVVVHLRLESRAEIPDALVADLLPAGLEPEIQSLAHGVKLEEISVDGQTLASLMEEQDALRHEEYRDDRYVAAVALYEGGVTNLIYLVRAVTPGVYKVPPPTVESMYRPEIRGVGATPALLKVEAR